MALHHAKPGKLVDLRPLGPKIKDAKSRAIIKSNHFETIRLIVCAGSKIPTHHVPGNVIIHCFKGFVEIGFQEFRTELKAHEWVYLDGGASHSVNSITDASLLMTILFDR